MNTAIQGDKTIRDVFCPHCSRRVTGFTFFRCEPTDSLTIDGVECYEDDDNLDPAVAVRCDHCWEFLPNGYYEPLYAKLCAATEEEDDETDADTD